MKPHRRSYFRDNTYDSETGLFYNYFRYYDPRTGRYITADPIGLNGGVNVYTYVGNDPVNWVDPLGLVKWTGTQTTVAAGMGGGAVRFKFELTSECVNGSQTKVEVIAGGAALSVGIPASFTYSKSVTFSDNRIIPSPRVFSGSSAYVYASWAMGYAGISAQSIRLGDASMTGVGGQSGWDTSITGGAGISTVTSASTSDCGCN